MPLRSKLALVFAGLLFVISAGCATNAMSQAEPIGDTWLATIAGDGAVLPHRVVLGWEHNDRIVWVSNFPLDREIVFDEPSPFGKNLTTYSLDSEQSCDPGPITNKTEHTYTYHVVSSAGVKMGVTGEGIIVITK